MFSITTMLLSTSMPMPTASPPRDTMFMVMPMRYRHIIAARIESGIVTAMISDERTFFKKRKMTTIASTPPIIMLITTLFMLVEMNSDWSSKRRTDAPYARPSPASKSAYMSFTASTTEDEFAPLDLYISITVPLMRLTSPSE